MPVWCEGVAGRRQDRNRDRHRQSRSDPRGGLLPPHARACRGGRCRGGVADLQGTLGPAGPGLRHEPSPVTEELVANIKLGAFERPASHLSRLEPQGAWHGQADKADRLVRRGNGPWQLRPRFASCCGLFRCMASTAIMPISCRGSACILQGCLVRFREWSVVDVRPPRPAPQPDSAPQYCIEPPLIRQVRNQHGDGAADEATGITSGAKAYGSGSITGSRRSSASFAGSRAR